MTNSLKERIEKASVGSRELDCRIAYALGMNWQNPAWPNDWRHHVETHGYDAAWTSDHVYRGGYASPPKENYSGSLVPDFTASLDAALALVGRLFPGCEYQISTFMGVAHVGLMPANTDVGPWYASRADSNVVLAILEALADLYSYGFTALTKEDQ